MGKCKSALCSVLPKWLGDTGAETLEVGKETKADPEEDAAVAAGEPTEIGMPAAESTEEIADR